MSKEYDGRLFGGTVQTGQLAAVRFDNVGVKGFFEIVLQIQQLCLELVAKITVFLCCENIFFNL